MLEHREETNIKIFRKELWLDFGPGLIAFGIRVLNVGVPKNLLLCWLLASQREFCDMEFISCLVTASR